MRFTRPALAASLTVALFSPSLLTAAAQQRYNPPVPNTAITDEQAAKYSDDYSFLSQQGTNYYNQGQMSKAIDYFKKALAIAPDISVPVLHNNLAAAYIKRGNYYLDEAHDTQNALNDYRGAYFYMVTGWPVGMEYKAVHQRNKQVARDNMLNAYKRLGINPADKAKHADMAKELRLKGLFQEALVEYAQAVDSNPGDSESTKAMGDLFNVLNMPEHAKKFYKQLITSDTTASDVSDASLVQLGNSLYKTGEAEDAVAYYNKALEINPNNITALTQLEKIWLNEIKFNPNSVTGHANLAAVYQKMKDYDRALQQYNAAEYFADQDPKTAFEVKKLIRLNMGTLFQEKKNYQLALKAYDTILKVDPNNKLAHYYKATLYKEAGNPDDAIKAYQKVLMMDPENTKARDELLAMLKASPDPTKVRLGLQEFAGRFSDNALIQAQVGEEFHKRNEYQLAIQYYNNAISINPRLASAYANLGSAYQSVGDDEKSLAAFQRATELDPSNKTVADLTQGAQSNLGLKAYQQGVELQQKGQFADSLTYFDRALKTDPNKAEYLAAYGVSLQNNNDVDGALRYYQKATAAAPGEGLYQYYLGTAYHQKNQLPQAKTAYQKALSLDGTLKDAREALVSLGEAEAASALQAAVDAYNAKQYAKSLGLLKTVLAANPNDAMALYYQGLAYEGAGNKAQAAASYRAAVAKDAQFADAYYALAVLLDDQNKAGEAKSAFQRFIELSAAGEGEAADSEFVKYARERVTALGG
ncbi:MAG: tetratricopeptide repeat protein [Candidatus Melainabacteria bacterium]